MKIKNKLLILLIWSTCLTGCALSSRRVYEPGKINGVQIENKFDNELIYTSLLHAHYLSFSGNVNSASAIFDSLTQRYPDNSDVNFQLARFYIDLVYRAQDRQTAISLLSMAKKALLHTIHISPDHLRAKKMLAEVYVELMELEKAVNVLEEVHAVVPNDQNVMVDLARLYVFTLSQNKAIELLEPVLNRDDVQNYDIYKVFALACAEEGRLDKAINAYMQYLEVFPGEYEASFNIALCYFQKADFEQSAYHLEILKNANRMTLEAAELYVDVLKAQGNYEEAIELLEVMRLDARAEVGADIEIGRIHLIMENPEAAHKHLARAVSKAPDDRRATFLNAVALSEMGKLSEALRLLEINLEDTPVSIASADLALNIYLETSQKNMARKLIDRLLTERNEDFRSYLISAHALTDLGLSAEAVKILRQGARMFPNDSSINLLLAYKLEQKGDWGESIEIAEELHKNDPGDATIANFIGYILADRNQDLKRALDLIELALEKDPDNGAYLDSLAWVYYRLGRYQDAFDVIRKAYRKLPDNPVIIEHFIRICIALDKSDIAISKLNDALEKFPEHEGLLECSKLLEDARDK